MSRTVADTRIPQHLVDEMSPAMREFFNRVLARVDQLTLEVAQLKAENQQLRSENQQLRRENTRLRQENAELREQLSGPQTPQNSSLPPSTQHPHARPNGRKPPSSRKRGGQPGHPRHERPLIPSDQCKEVVALAPERCRHCETALTGVDPEPLRHQVWELPPIQPEVTEYQRHRLQCPTCGKTTCAELPPGVPTGQAGPRLIAMSALLMAYFRQSKRRTALFLTALLNQPCCAAWVVKLQNLATPALRPGYEELVAALPQEPILGGDETPGKEADRKTWLWTFVAATFTVFTIRPSWAASTIRELLGSTFAGVVSCDRAKMYWMLPNLQWCWAHLKRDFQAVADRPNGQARELGEALLAETDRLFDLWYRCRDGTLSRAELKQRMQPVREELEGLLLRGAQLDISGVAGMCRELTRHRNWLWTFLDVEGLGPTNNASERALRHAVIWRKLSFGTQSEKGSRFVETMLTAIETCRQQNRSVLDYVTSSVQAHFNGRTAPSLLNRA